MIEMNDEELVEIGQRAASQIEGLGKVEHVRVKIGLDEAERVIYFFRFLIDDPQRQGLALTRLGQKIRDDCARRQSLSLPFGA